MTTLFDAPIIEPPNEGPHFDGDTYEPELDFARLHGQLFRVWHAMRDGQWHTLESIAKQAGCSPASASARLRDLRKPKFGSFLVERRRVRHGLHEYRVGGRGEGEPESRTCVHCATALKAINEETTRTINDYFVNPNSGSGGKLDGLQFAKQQLEREHKNG